MDDGLQSYYDKTVIELDSSSSTFDWGQGAPIQLPPHFSKVVLIGSGGYVGNYLFAALESLLGERLIGVDPRHGHGNPKKIARTHQELESCFFSDVDAVLFFGGVSSVGQAARNPSAAFNENTLGLFELYKKLDAKTHFVYASSASVYSQSRALGAPSREGDPISGNSNAYDATKLAGELSLVGQSGSSHTALRMGTVSGASPLMRWDLVFNAMVKSATNDGVVRVSNPQAHRSILFLSDLLKVIIALLNIEGPPPRVLNVASHSSTIGMLGKEIAETLEAKLIFEADTPTYDFVIDTELAKGFASVGDLSIFQEAQRLSGAIQKGVVK
jgi:nucleoside-diphosphate-sugar epimerase